jgi:nucleoside 2-deoxyribosyltransferase
MRCFVIMPFGDEATDPEQAAEWEALYEWIKRSVESVSVPGADERIVCHRADKEVRPGQIIAHVVENLLDADIVIADLSGQRPNVFYELGVRHALHSNTIIIAQRMEDIPFDLRGQRAFVYHNNNLTHLLKLQDHLTKAVGTITSTPDFIDNPVGSFLQRRKVEASLSESPSGYDVMKNMVAELASVKRGFEVVAEEVRRITRAVTAAEAPGPTADTGPQDDLSFFEGVWTSETSMYCARVVRGELRVPYSYGGDSHLTAHFYNCKLIGDTFFARFEWLIGNISGYAFHTVVGDDRLEGGWWFSDEMPEEVVRDISRISAAIPGMNRSVWHRTAKTTRFPEWAEKYFRDLEGGAAGEDPERTARGPRLGHVPGGPDGKTLAE